jgi:serine protease AprX
MNDNGKSVPAYFELSGTSMATPMVAGVAALMIQQNPSLTPDEVKARLMKTATKFAPGISTATDPTTGIVYTDEYDIFTIGAGYLNIPAALADNETFSGVALSPTATFDATSGQVFIQPGALLAVWGTGTVSPTLAVWGTGAVWGTIAVWGTSTPQAFSDIWGTLAVWGTGQSSGEIVTLAINGDN